MGVRLDPLIARIEDDDAVDEDGSIVIEHRP
jgi:hypothetical protein